MNNTHVNPVFADALNSMSPPTQGAVIKKTVRVFFGSCKNHDDHGIPGAPGVDIYADVFVEYTKPPAGDPDIDIVRVTQDGKVIKGYGLGEYAAECPNCGAETLRDDDYIIDQILGESLLEEG